MRIRTELMKGNLPLLVLSLLSKEDMYGYEISKRISVGSNDLINLKEGSLYPALHLLEKNDFVTGYWVPQEGKPSRRYYRITPKGQQELAYEKENWREFTSAVGRILEIKNE
jgi:PadR family transcriptional regulator, regulatory protein PadR